MSILISQKKKKIKYVNLYNFFFYWQNEKAKRTNERNKVRTENTKMRLIKSERLWNDDRGKKKIEQERGGW